VLDPSTKIHALLEAELSLVNDSRVVKQIRAHLVTPVAIQRAWDYGKPDEAYTCWSVLDHPKSNSGIAYCELGFGPRTPWGLVTLTGKTDMSIGMDSGWFGTFLQAFFDSAAATELPVWRVFKQSDDHYPGVPITEESDWNSTWETVYRLRATDPKVRYHCEQSIYVWRAET
jgi:hypothetical protein